MAVYFGVTQQIMANNREPFASACISQNKMLSANEVIARQCRLKCSGGDDGEPGFHVNQCKWCSCKDQGLTAMPIIFDTFC